MINLTEAMNRIESRLRSARMEDESSYEGTSASNLTHQESRKHIVTHNIPRVYNYKSNARKGVKTERGKKGHPKGKGSNASIGSKVGKGGKKQSKAGGKRRKGLKGKKINDDISGAVAFVSNPSTPSTLKTEIQQEDGLQE